MTNIHGLNNLGSGNGIRGAENNHSPYRDNGFAGQNGMDNWNYNVENLRAVENHKVLFVSGNTPIKNPRDQNYWDMVKITCCPVCSFISITLVIFLVVLGMFIAECVKGIDKNQDLLTIKANVLLDLGANFSPYVKKGEAWRLLSAQFLHVNFLHLVGNGLTILIFVSRVEYSFGWWKTLIIYLISGIGGNIFSCLTSSNVTSVKAGASTSLYGIIGVIIAYLIVNWKGLDIIGRLLKCQLVFTTIMITIFILLLTPYTQSIDYLGHLGGFLTGLTICGIHSTIRNGKRQKVMRIIMITLCVGLLTLWFLLFYLKS